MCVCIKYTATCLSNTSAAPPINRGGESRKSNNVFEGGFSVPCYDSVIITLAEGTQRTKTTWLSFYYKVVR